MQESRTKSALAATLVREEQKILACVHCGLCLEACPTYVITGDENDSPRGRIYLMRAVEEDRLAKTSSAFQRHIDRCLGCRACETVCPAGVEYGQLLEAARGEIMSAPARRGPTYSLMRFVLRHVWLQPSRLRAAFRLARLIRDTGVASLLLKTNLAKLISPRFEFALSLLQSSAPALAARNRASANVECGGKHSATPLWISEHEFSTKAPSALRSAGALQSAAPARDFGALLFRGCVTDGLFGRVNEATARVLAVNGCTVNTPENQVCCGALHAHAGDLEGARSLARQNIDAFEVGQAFLPVTSSRVRQDRSQHIAAPPIVTNAGGCGAMLVSYAHLLADDRDFKERARQFSARVRDIGQQLDVTGIREGAAIGPAPITYDGSCHLLNGQHAGDASLKMLSAVPDLRFVPLEGSDVCCGGAGVYNLLESDLSGKVLAEKLKHIEQSGAKVLATGNAGCHMQIGAGARLAEMDLRVCHPIELLDKSYDRAGFYSGQNRLR